MTTSKKVGPSLTKATRGRKPKSKSKVAKNRQSAKMQVRTKLPQQGLRADSKLAPVIAMLRGSQGATIAALCKATGWQPHSVRGALSGAIKKKLGLLVISEKTDGARVYRVTN